MILGRHPQKSLMIIKHRQWFYARRCRQLLCKHLLRDTCCENLFLANTANVTDSEQANIHIFIDDVASSQQKRIVDETLILEGCSSLRRPQAIMLKAGRKILPSPYLYFLNNKAEFGDVFI